MRSRRLTTTPGDNVMLSTPAKPTDEERIREQAEAFLDGKRGPLSTGEIAQWLNVMDELKQRRR